MLDPRPTESDPARPVVVRFSVIFVRPRVYALRMYAVLLYSERLATRAMPTAQASGSASLPSLRDQGGRKKETYLMSQPAAACVYQSFLKSRAFIRERRNDRVVRAPTTSTPFAGKEPDP